MKKAVLDKVLNELNLTNTTLLEAGFFSRVGNSIASAGSKVANAVGNAATTVGAAPANVARAVANTAANSLQTNSAIINGGSLFVGPDGKFVGLKGIDPNSPTGKYLAQQYTNAGYKPASAEDRLRASTQPLQVISPQQMTGNLKATTIDAIEQLKTLASQMEKQISSKQTLTSQEAATLYQQLTNFIVTNIRKAQSNMAPGQQPTQQTPPTTQQPSTPQQPAPTTQQQAVTQPAPTTVSKQAPPGAGNGGVTQKPANQIQPASTYTQGSLLNQTPSKLPPQGVGPQNNNMPSWNRSSIPVATLPQIPLSNQVVQSNPAPQGAGNITPTAPPKPQIIQNQNPIANFAFNKIPSGTFNP